MSAHGEMPALEELNNTKDGRSRPCNSGSLKEGAGLTWEKYPSSLKARNRRRTLNGTKPMIE